MATIRVKRKKKPVKKAKASKKVKVKRAKKAKVKEEKDLTEEELAVLGDELDDGASINVVPPTLEPEATVEGGTGETDLARIEAATVVDFEDKKKRKKVRVKRRKK